VLGGVVFSGFFGVVSGVQRVPVRDVRVVRGLFVMFGVVVFRCLTMVLGRLLVMFRCLPVMISALVLRHVRLRRAMRASCQGIVTTLVEVVGALTFDAQAWARQTRLRHEQAVAV
jgi:hypothetical protein